MLQRIQSIFLLISSMVGGLMYFLPFSTTNESIKNSVFLNKKFDVFDNPIIMGGVGVLCAILLINIFLYANRKLQMKINSLVLFGILGVVGYIGFQLVMFVKDNISVEFSIGTFLPILMALFTLLANRSIRSDEKLVKSMDSIR